MSISLLLTAPHFSRKVRSRQFLNKISSFHQPFFRLVLRTTRTIKATPAKQDTTSIHTTHPFAISSELDIMGTNFSSRTRRIENACSLTTESVSESDLRTGGPARPRQRRSVPQGPRRFRARDRAKRPQLTGPAIHCNFYANRHIRRNPALLLAGLATGRRRRRDETGSGKNTSGSSRSLL